MGAILSRAESAMRAACGRAQMAIFGRREGSLAAGWLADQNAGYSALELGSRSRLGSHLVMKVGISRQRHSRLVAALTQGVCPICERNGSGEAPPGRSAALTASQTISVTRGDAD